MKVTKWSIFNGDLTVSDQEAEKTSGDTGSLSASSSAETPAAPVTASADAAKEEAKDASKPAEAAPTEAKAEASKPETSTLSGKVIVMSRRERGWADSEHAAADAEAGESVFGKRRIAALAAVVAVAVVAGGMGGALATAVFMRGNDVVAADTSHPAQPAMQASLSRLDSDMQALKAGLEHTSKIGMSQFNKTSDRLDKLERAQAEPAAKLAKLSEAVDRLRAAPAPVPAVAAAAPAPTVAAAPAPAVAKDTTGSIASPAAPQQQAAALPEPKSETKPELGRLPTLEGWVLREVGYGGAWVESRRGSYEVYAGDTIPGLGRVDAIRRQDGRWVVITSRGLIVSR